ncbi:MAG TPA: AAA family ATPase, partial [Blastocatellia bacterium]|nr:AAA family ATPase [Blastocatellia bacterium]
RAGFRGFGADPGCFPSPGVIDNRVNWALRTELEGGLIKVALVGTHGVNKTTIAYELAGVLKRKGKTVELLTEIARECPFPLNEQATREAYQWIIARQVQLEIEKSPRADILVCDRSVLDNFAYYVRRYSRNGQEAEALEAYCRSWIETYDFLVRLPISEPLAADGFRSTDEDFQSEIDRLCDEMFEQHYNERTRPAYVRGALSAGEIARFILETHPHGAERLLVG